jgi:hypothetical protein
LNPITSIMTLDLATSVGWSRWTSPDRVECGTRLLPRGDVGLFFDAFESWLGDVLEQSPPGICVFEAPLVYAGTNQTTARKLMGLACFAEFICRRAGVQSLECNVMDVRTHFLGLGWGKHLLRKPGETSTSQTAKRMAFERSRNRGWNPQTDDEADALALLDFAAHCLRGSAKVSWDCAPAGVWSNDDGRGWKLYATQYAGAKNGR